MNATSKEISDGILNAVGKIFFYIIMAYLLFFIVFPIVFYVAFEDSSIIWALFMVLALFFIIKPMVVKFKNKRKKKKK